MTRLFNVNPLASLSGFWSRFFGHLSRFDLVFLVGFLTIHFFLSLFKSQAALLPIYDGDSYAFLQKLVLMLDGIMERDPIKHVSYGFYNYGYGYFLFLLALSWPWILLNKLGAVIFICRFVSSLFIVGMFIVFKKCIQK